MFVFPFIMLFRFSSRKHCFQCWISTFAAGCVSSSNPSCTWKTSSNLYKSTGCCCEKRSSIFTTELNCIALSSTALNSTKLNETQSKLSSTQLNWAELSSMKLNETQRNDTQLKYLNSNSSTKLNETIRNETILFCRRINLWKLANGNRRSFQVNKTNNNCEDCSPSTLLLVAAPQFAYSNTCKHPHFWMFKTSTVTDFGYPSQWPDHF